MNENPVAVPPPPPPPPGPRKPGVQSILKASLIGKKKQTRINVVSPRPEIPGGVPAGLREVYWSRDEVYTWDQKRAAYSDAAKGVKTYSDDIIKRWKKDIDTYLLVAGLFSAILTAFNVPTYLLLQQDPISLLQEISEELRGPSRDSLSLGSLGSPQSSAITAANASTPPLVPAWAMWLNGLWFSGLIFSCRGDD